MRNSVAWDNGPNTSRGAHGPRSSGGWDNGPRDARTSPPKNAHRGAQDTRSIPNKGDGRNARNNQDRINTQYVGGDQRGANWDNREMGANRNNSGGWDNRDQKFGSDSGGMPNMGYNQGMNQMQSRDNRDAWGGDMRNTNMRNDMGGGAGWDRRDDRDMPRRDNTRNRDGNDYDYPPNKFARMDSRPAPENLRNPFAHLPSQPSNSKQDSGTGLLGGLKIGAVMENIMANMAKIANANAGNYNSGPMNSGNYRNTGGPNMGRSNMGGQNMGGQNMRGQSMRGQNMGGPNMNNFDNDFYQDDYDGYGRSNSNFSPNPNFPPNQYDNNFNSNFNAPPQNRNRGGPPQFHTSPPAQPMNTPINRNKNANRKKRTPPATPVEKFSQATSPQKPVVSEESQSFLKKWITDNIATFPMEKPEFSQISWQLLYIFNFQIPCGIKGEYYVIDVWSFP